MASKARAEARSILDSALRSLRGGGSNDPVAPVSPGGVAAAAVASDAAIDAAGAKVEVKLAAAGPVVVEAAADAAVEKIEALVPSDEEVEKALAGLRAAEAEKEKAAAEAAAAAAKQAAADKAAKNAANAPARQAAALAAAAAKLEAEKKAAAAAKAAAEELAAKQAARAEEEKKEAAESALKVAEDSASLIDFIKDHEVANTTKNALFNPQKMNSALKDKNMKSVRAAIKEQKVLIQKSIQAVNKSKSDLALLKGTLEKERSAITGVNANSLKKNMSPANYEAFFSKNARILAINSGIAQIDSTITSIENAEARAAAASGAFKMVKNAAKVVIGHPVELAAGVALAAAAYYCPFGLSGVVAIAGTAMKVAAAVGALGVARNLYVSGLDVETEIEKAAQAAGIPFTITEILKKKVSPNAAVRAQGQADEAALPPKGKAKVVAAEKQAAAAVSAAGAAANVKPADGCAGKTCPKIYGSNRGDKKKGDKCGLPATIKGNKAPEVCVCLSHKYAEQSELVAAGGSRTRRASKARKNRTRKMW